jgi:hypothetical protein
MTEEERRELREIYVGVSDEALKRIGLVMVLGAGLDHDRMTLLERAGDVPVLESARFKRDELTREIAKVYSRPPLDRLADRVEAWQSDVRELLQIRDRYAHSVTYYEVRGDGSAGSFSHHPKTGAITAVVDEPELDDEVWRFTEVGSIGVDLDIETGILRERGAQEYDAYLRSKRESERLHEEWLRERQRSLEERLREPPTS